MLQQYIWKKKKILRGLLNTKVRKHGVPYNANSWWDSDFYISGVTDRQTISPRKSEMSSLYHYCSVEELILRHLFNNNIATDNINILDIGSGSGHWIDFWQKLGAYSIDGIDISKSSIDHLKSKYSSNESIRVHQGRSVDVIRTLNRSFSVVSAIGVMFHLVEDQEWSDTISAVADNLDSEGMFVIGGHFGMLDGIDVQIDQNGHINKRLRSKRHWVRKLRESGFSTCRLYRNNAYLGIRDTLPENNILIAHEGKG